MTKVLFVDEALKVRNGAQDAKNHLPGVVFLEIHSQSSQLTM
jgi:hypothetical protein